MDQAGAEGSARASASAPDRGSLPKISRRQDLFTAGFAVVALAGVAVFTNPALRLALLTVATVFAMSIVWRSALEDRVAKWGLQRDIQLELRFYLLPLIALCAAFALGLVELHRAIEVAREKYIIVVLILVFGLLANGLEKSRYFEWAALRASRRGRGDTQRLLLNLFLVMATLTIVTSNDIMVFAFTPLVILMMKQSGIWNARLPLLILFVAANTSSMALYLGSPTNIILSQAVDLSPFSYTFVMLVPTVLSLLATLIVVEALNRAAFGVPDSRLRRWRMVNRIVRPLKIAETYSTLQPADPIIQDAEMRRWVRAFMLSVVVVFGFGFATRDLVLPVALVALIAAITFSRSTAANLGRAVRRLPFQLVPFALTFFVVADAFGRTASFRELAPVALGGLLDLSDPMAALKLIAASGVSVNIFNDLPASALWGEALQALEAQGFFAVEGGRMARILALQTVLVGVNIGTYLTPFGALAGIIWLNQMKVNDNVRESASSADGSRRIEVPNILHLVAYGFAMFAFVAVATAIGMIAPLMAFDVLLSAPGEPSTGGLSVASLGFTRWFALVVPSVLVIVLLAAQSTRVLRRTRLMDDIRQWLLPISSATRGLILRAELTYRIGVVAVLVLAMGGLIQWVEITHSLWYGAEEFATGGGFFGWFLVFVGSGEPIGDIFPRSWLGAVLAGLLPISALGGLVIVTRIPSGKWERRVKEHLARGVIPAKRIVIIGFQPQHEPLIQQLREDDTTFVLLMVDPDELEGAEEFTARAADSRIHVVEAVRGATRLLQEYNLAPSLRYDPPLLIVFGAHRKGSNVESLRALSELCRVIGPAQQRARPVATTIVFECSSEDEYQRTCGLSERLRQSGHELVPVYAHRDYAALLVADLDADLRAMGDHLGLSSEVSHGVRLFRNPAHLVARPLREQELDLLADGRAHRIGPEVVGVIATVGGADAMFTPEDFQSLGIDEAARRSTLRAVITIAEGEDAAPVSDALRDDRRTARPLVVVNDTARSRRFVARALSADPSRTIRLVTGERENRVLHRGLAVARASTPLEAAERVLIDGETLLEAGARVYVFLREGENYATEGWTLEFLQALEQLQVRIVQAGNGFDVPSHENLYVVVESRVHGEHGYKFVHNQLYVDSVFDPSMGERSVFAAFAQMIARFGLPEAPEPAATTLRSFAQAAGELANVEARRIADASIFGAIDAPRLVGMRGAEVAALVAEHSFPPRRLLSVLRLRYDASTVNLEPVADGPSDLADVVLTELDLLVLLPAL